MNQNVIKIKKGVDLPIAGAIKDSTPSLMPATGRVALFPADYPGLLLKLAVAEGDSVAAGQALFFDKKHNGLKVVSPVAGTVAAVVRGERRKILRIEIAVDGQNSTAATLDPLTEINDRSARSYLTTNGLWALMRQRPYDVVPAPDVEVRDFFVAGFDSAPLAPGLAVALADEVAAMEKGVALLSAITKGRVFVTRRPGSLPDIKGAEMLTIEGPHPAGNVGTAINRVAPVNKGEVVVTLDLQTLVRIGKSLISGRPQWETLVGITGSEVANPSVVRTTVGVSMNQLLDGKLKTDKKVRVVSGNVLSGINVGADGYLRYPYTQVSVIPEGDDVVEFMGWASLSPRKMSLGRSFPGRWLKRLFTPDARINGGRRAMIMSGEYEDVMPLDIMPEYLIKAILSRDIDKMEQLGIYEVAPEDFALAEYADTSKLELQKIVREGLDFIRKENE